MKRISVSYARGLIIQRSLITLMLFFLGMRGITYISVIEEFDINGSIRILFTVICLSILIIAIVFSLVSKLESPIETQKDNRNNLLSNIIVVVSSVVFIFYIVSIFKDSSTFNISLITPFLLSAIFFLMA
ncbi:putative membrane protein [Clostridioides difficile CD160]|nr:putative membrane protein [Clostridioides difficile CD160]